MNDWLLIINVMVLWGSLVWRVRVCKGKVRIVTS
jgi:hypothetical protein